VGHVKLRSREYRLGPRDVACYHADREHKEQQVNCIDGGENNTGGNMHLSRWYTALCLRH
jgi:hypothetical protein